MYAIIEMTGQRVTSLTLHTTRGEAIKRTMDLTDRRDARSFLSELRKRGYVITGKKRYHVAEVSNSSLKVSAGAEAASEPAQDGRRKR